MLRHERHQYMAAQCRNHANRGRRNQRIKFRREDTKERKSQPVMLHQCSLECDTPDNELRFKFELIGSTIGPCESRWHKLIPQSAI